MDVLVLSKSFQAPGGIVNFIRSVLDHLPEGISARHLPIGREPGRESSPLTWGAPLKDNVRLARAVRSQRPSCVHVNASLNWPSLLRDGAFLLTLRALRYDHVLLYFHGWDPATAEQIRSNPILARAVRSLLNRLPVICVLATPFKRTLEAIGVDAHRIHLVTTMYDASIFEGVHRRRSESGPLITFLGRLVEQKGAADVMRSFATILEEQPDATLVIAGDGPQKAELERLAAELALGDRVRFPGYLTGSEKAQALVDSDLFVFPTRYGEGCPVSLLEAMAAGLPIVTTRVGGIPDFLENDVNALLLDEVTPDSLSAAMHKALNDTAWAARCSCANRSKATRELSGRHVVGNLVDLYRTAAGTP